MSDGPNGPDSFQLTEPPTAVRRARELGVKVPPPPRIPIIEKPDVQPPISSRFGNVTKDATTRVSVSLGFIGALMFAAYQAGMARAKDSETLAAKIGELETRVKELETSFNSERAECQSAFRSQTVIESRLQSVQGELVQINSKIERR